MKDKTVNVLWTGGWDSTFRIIQLAEKELIIQPYYLKDNRKSEKFELNTIKILTEAINKLELTKSNICKLKIVKVTDIEKDNEITKAYHKIFEDFKLISSGKKLGSQYEWLARFSKNISSLELSIEKGAKIIDIVNEFGAFKGQIDEEKGEYFIIDKNSSSKEINTIFGNYHYPLLNLSKLEMKKIAEEKGYIDIMNKTWFCHSPIDKNPCGKCSPCIQAIEAGLKNRFTKKALLRYTVKKNKFRLKNIFSFYN